MFCASHLSNFSQGIHWLLSGGEKHANSHLRNDGNIIILSNEMEGNVSIMYKYFSFKIVKKIIVPL